MTSLAIGIGLIMARSGGEPPEAAAPAIVSVALSTTEPRAGEAITCVVVWTGYPRTGVAYQWKLNGSNVAGATGASYAPPAAAIGGNLACAVVVDNGVGTDSETSAAWPVLGEALPAVLLIVAGQSNARAANTSAANAPAKYLGPSHAAMWVEGSGFAAYSAGGNSDSKGASGTWGSEAEFIHQVNQAFPGRAVYVVKEAVNGATMANLGSNSFAPGVGNGRFAQLESQVVAAKAALVAAAVPFEELGLFNQGEGDTESDAAAAAYKTNFETFLAAYRTRISAGDFLIERIRPFAGDLGQKPYNRTYAVRQAQEQIAGAAGGVGIISLDFAPGNFAELHPGAGWTEAKGLRAHAWWAGGYAATYGAVADTTPNNLDFADQAGVAANTLTTSDTISIAGIGGHAPVSVAGGEYRIRNPDDTEWLDWTAASGTIHPFQKLQLRATSSAATGGSVAVTVTVGPATETWTITTATATASNEAETNAFLARIAALSGDAMSTAEAAALDAFYVTAKASTWWPRLHRLYVGGLHDAVASSIDLRDQTTRLTQVGNIGAVAWSAASGWHTGGDSGRGLDMHFNPATGTAQNSIALFLWCPSFAAAGGSASAFDIQGSDISVRLRQNDVGNLQCRLHAGGNQTKTGITGAAGFRCVSRTASGATAFYGPNGESLGTDTTVSAAPTASSLYMFAPVTGSTSGRGLLVAGVSDGLTAAEVLGLRNALTTLGSAFWLA